ncbi:MAG TPA: hypothetical protein VG994_02785 [Steroidobacteraceae bacterium]|nr:hypothetical protein [Steroidobacteraceae bacterium]
MWKVARIAVLLVLLVIVAGMTWIDKAQTTSWKAPLWVGIFPMNGDGSAASEAYVRNLTSADFAAIETFFMNEAHRYGVAVERPVRIELYPPPAEKPPLLKPGSGALGAILWSLQMRLYARRAADVPGRAPSHIRVFVLFHDPATTDRVPHSLGLQKGLVGVVYAYADRGMRGQNNIVIAHETMHTLGATDKYDVASGAPLYPDGYAEPEREPRFPQPKAEIMAGKRPLSGTTQEMPDDLRGEAVGRATAREIGWIKS